MGARYVCVKTHTVTEPPNEWVNIQLHAHTKLHAYLTPHLHCVLLMLCA